MTRRPRSLLTRLAILRLLKSVPASVIEQHWF